jgi:SAM-dependent methyltransferase
MPTPLSKYEMTDLIERQMQSYHSILSKIANTECKAKQSRQKKGCFDFIAHSLPQVANCIHLAVKYLKENKKHSIYYPKFLDCGCGYGNIMFLAYHLGCSAHGIDLNERALNLARTNNGRNYPEAKHWRVYRRDILTYKDYGEYDIVYYYCPMQDGSLEKKFEAKLANDMRVGAIALPFYSISTFRKDKRFVHLGEFTGLSEYGYGHIMIKTEE